MSEIKTPKFVEDFANYLVAIRNLSQVYIKNMTVTIEQFLEFINVHKFKNKYNTIEDITLNEIRSLNNSDIYSFIFFLAESHYQNNSRVIKIEHLNITLPSIQAYQTISNRRLLTPSCIDNRRVS